MVQGIWDRITIPLGLGTMLEYDNVIIHKGTNDNPGIMEGFASMTVWTVYV